MKRLIRVRYISSQLGFVTFAVYLFFYFCFNFELLINIHTFKSYKMNRTFSRNNYIYKTLRLN